MKYKRLFYLTISGLASLAVLAGCEKEGARTGIIRPVVKGVETKSGPVIIDDNAAYSGSSGTNSEKLSVKGFVMDAWLASEGHDNETDATVPVHYINNAGVTYDDSEGWGISGTPVWINGIATRFWCWNTLAESSGLSTSLDYSETSDSRDFSFKVPSTSSYRRDIVMAYTKKTWAEGDSHNHGSDDNVNLRFHHPLANICFGIKEDTFSSILDITEITLKNVYTQGNFSYTGSGFTWSGQTAKGNITETDGVSKANIRNINFFIPEQAPGADTMLSVTFRRTDGTTVTREVSLQGSTEKWSADSYYCYRIEATDALNQPIVFTIDLVAWNTYTETSGDLTLNY